jgi:predicted porin
MKKSLIALAVLAASGAAMAQSSVTVYGIADIWFGSAKSQVNTGAGLVGERQTVLESGGVSGSRFGFKGTEDLGGGLKAIFLLEQGFNLDTGTAKDNTKAFSRQAYVGLAGGFGEVKLGNVFTAYDDISGATTSAFDSALSATNNVFISNLYTSNPTNNIYYATPSFGGFSGAVSYGLGEDKTSTTSASNTVSAHVKYENGPIFAGAAYQREKDGASGQSVKFTRLNGSYDFGVAKLLASYGRVSEDVLGTKSNEYHIGVDVPLSGALTLSGGYAASKTKLGGTEILKSSGVGVALAYSLSKRTTVYTGIHNSSSETAGVKVAKNSVYAVGLKHTF